MRSKDWFYYLYLSYGKRTDFDYSRIEVYSGGVE